METGEGLEIGEALGTGGALGTGEGLEAAKESWWWIVYRMGGNWAPLIHWGYGYDSPLAQAVGLLLICFVKDNECVHGCAAVRAPASPPRVRVAVHTQFRFLAP